MQTHRSAINGKYQNKYRIPSTRLQKWDYGWNAPYFVTICTAHRICYFGEIRNGKMFLSELGEIVVAEWLKTPIIRPDMNLVMDEFVVMPNHFHGIIVIGKNEYNTRRDAMHGVSTVSTASTASTASTVSTVSTVSTASTVIIPTISTTETIIENQPHKNYKYGPQIKNLSSIIRGFKSSVTKHSLKTNTEFAWQPRFHEHIIRDKKSHTRIRNYIQNNPENWNIDMFYK